MKPEEWYLLVHILTFLGFFVYARWAWRVNTRVRGDGKLDTLCKSDWNYNAWDHFYDLDEYRNSLVRWTIGFFLAGPVILILGLALVIFAGICCGIGWCYNKMAKLLFPYRSED